jgi:magnesium transporter
VLRAWKYRDGVPAEATAFGDVDVTPDTLYWVEAIDVTADELEQIRTQLRVDDLAMEDLSEGRQRTKLESYGDHWHVALHDCQLEGTDLVTHELDVLFGAGWLLTMHHHDDDALLVEMRRRYERERIDHEIVDEGSALWATLDVIVDRWFTVSDHIDEQLETVEDVIFANKSAATPQGIFALRRTLVSFRRTVSPTREVLASLLRRDVDVIDGPALARLHDVNDHVIRVIELIEGQRELLAGLLEAQLTIASNRTNEVMKATSSWGAILVSNTLIAGVYGMNFRHMPELHWVLGYPLSLALMVVVTVGGYRLFKRRGWL